jgi:hypothetical protein
MCRARTPQALAALDAALKDPKTRVMAAIYLLNRGYGAPPQKIEGVESASFTFWHLIAARAFEPVPGPVVDGAVVSSTAGRPRIVVDLSRPPAE